MSEPQPPSVLIVGAGIIGAACACHLARAGAAVTVLDAAAPASGASGASFGWINASFFADDDHFRLRAAGIAAWHRLSAAVPGLPLHWGGALWWEDTGAAFDAMERNLVTLGYNVTRLEEAAVAEAAPALIQPPRAALRFGDEGALDGAAATRVLLRAAAADGAHVVTGVAVQTVLAGDAGITGVDTAQGRYVADHVILANGAGAAALLAPLGLDLPMLGRPGVLLTTQPVDITLDGIWVAPGQELRQSADGRLVLPTSPNHQADDSETVPDDPRALAEAALDRAAALIGTRPVPEQITLALRPVPGDGLPVLGPAGPRGLHVAVMHSGMTLAAIAAETVAAPILGQPSSPLAAPYGLQRFQS